MRNTFRKAIDDFSLKKLYDNSVMDDITVNYDS